MRLIIIKFYVFIKYNIKGLYNPFNIVKQLEKSQYWDRDRIKKFQLKQINRLVKEAKEKVMFYQKDKYKNQLNFQNLNLFSSIFPVIVKEDIKGNTNILVNKSIKKRIKHSTSGSTGKPMTIEIPLLAESYRIASRLRFYHWWKIDFYDKNILIWRKPEKKKDLYSLLKEIELKFLGKLYLDVFNLNNNTISDYFNKIEKFKPKYIRGYKSGIFELAKLMDKNNLQFTNSHLKLTVVTSETLFNYERVFIEKVFNCKVANEYGSADGGQYAFECPHGSLHINEESVYISTDDERNAHITELFNNGMPLINFKNEDRIRISNDYCSCGRNLKVITEIEGRSTDYIICEDGPNKHSLVFIGIFNSIQAKHNDSIRQFRVIQNGNKLEFEIIAGKNYNKEVEQFLILLIHKEISNTLKVEIKLVNYIQREKNGKLRYFIRKK